MTDPRTPTYSVVNEWRSEPTTEPELAVSREPDGLAFDTGSETVRLTWKQANSLSLWIQMAAAWAKLS